MRVNLIPVFGRWCLVVVALAATGCGGPPVDVAEALRVTDVTTGWLEADPAGTTKLVPTISFRLDNDSDRRLGVLQVNSVFRRVDEDLAWASVLIRAVGSEGLEPGASAGPFTVRSEFGYTGQQARPEMLAHREFVDVTVELFVKHRATPWVRLGQFDIGRQLLADEPAASVGGPAGRNHR